MTANADKFKSYITVLQDFPKPGVSFKDISPLVMHALPDVTKALIEMVDPSSFEFVAGIEARGFIFASALAQALNKGVVLIRKKGKLPPPVEAITYNSEYSTETLEMMKGNGEKILLVDDIIALGNTLIAGEELATKAGYKVVDKIAVADLTYLNKHGIKALIHLDS